MNIRTPKVGIVSLGCPSALVDSERILAKLRADGYAISGSYADADVVIVNTCGFLGTTRAESLEAIGEALAENGRVVVTGCLGADPAAIRAAFPQVLAIAGPQQYEAVVAAVHAAAPPDAAPPTALVPPEGVRLTPRHYAYLKIAEGCGHGCAFCAVPGLRGPLASRPAGAVIAEAEALVDAGVQELIVVSHDAAAYGSDLGHAESSWRGGSLKAGIVDLCRTLGKFGAWVRLQSAYPGAHLDDLVSLMADRTILPYLDIPFQHAVPHLVHAMRSPGDREGMLDRIEDWRDQVPDLTLRGTFVVGFPGETDADFEALLDWLKAAELDRVGCFKYENVAGTDSFALPGQVPETVKEARWQRLVQEQQAASAKRMAAKIGSVIEVLVDEVDEDGAIGRSTGDAPDGDGAVFLNGDHEVAAGDIVAAEVEYAEDYDLWAVRIED
jgi:ribosomal protein S12 methylthiotransferase